MDIYSNTRYYIFAAFLIIFMNLGGCGVGNSTAPLVDANHPQGLIANSGSRIVELSWNGIPSATSYTIYWSNSENVNRYDSATINTQEPYFQHRDLANGINYYYIVSAHTGAGESAPSDVVVGIPQAAPPALPENIKLRPDDKRVTIDFDIVAGATNYTLYWSNEDDVSKTSNRIDNIFPPFVHTGLTNAQPYYYLLLTQNAQGQTSSTEILSAIPQKALPMAPVITEAATINDKVTITWNDISNAENFDLYWGTHKDITIDDASISKVSSPYIFAPIEKAAGKHYYFRVIAHNSAGTSLLSNEVEIETPDTVIISSPGAAPGAPKISDSNGTQLVSVDIEDRQLTLNWVATPGEESLGYNLYWKKGSGSAIEDINIDKDDYDQKIVNIKPPYTHVGLQNDIYYYYRISAINNGGESELSQHPVIVAKPEIVKPGIPTGVNVIGGDGQIVVSWNPVQRASNYNVSLYNGDTTTDYTNANSPFTISELKNGSVYGIRVYAINGIKSGEGSASIESSPKEPVTNAPEVLTASPGNRLVTLQWTTASPQHVDDKEELAKNYRIYYRTRSGVTPNNGILLESPEIIQLKDQELWQTTIPDLKNGQRYYFVVTAVNAGGESQASPQAWALPQAEIPNAPQNVYAEAGNNKITIHFTGIGD
ncbi:MAG: fibronectin type III domain-containing protein, partial [Gammaproteobacteria bacterium]|nr:fibronectin type III domain-containing protein [Gammaproteobacteria bacterium]